MIPQIGIARVPRLPVEFQHIRLLILARLEADKLQAIRRVAFLVGAVLPLPRYLRERPSLPAIILPRLQTLQPRPVEVALELDRRARGLRLGLLAGLVLAARKLDQEPLRARV